MSSSCHLPHPRNDAVSVAYTYDGTLEGILSAVFSAYATHTQPEDIMDEALLTPRLGQQLIPVTTDMEQALRVRRTIVRSCGEPTFNAIAAASLSGDAQRGTIIYRFIRYAIEQNRQSGCSGCKRRSTCSHPCGRPASTGILNDIAHPAVEPLTRLERKVSNEAERMRQFIRFQHMDNDTWFARCNPSCNVVPLIMDWFSARFNTQPFMIYDEVHHLAGIHRQRSWYLVNTEGISLPAPSPEEAMMQTAWRSFYRALSIDERYNPELRRQFMPKRLWCNLTEMQMDTTTHLSHRTAV